MTIFEFWGKRNYLSFGMIPWAISNINYVSELVDGFESSGIGILRGISDDNSLRESSN